MRAIKLFLTVAENRQITLPPEVPPGPVELVVLYPDEVEKVPEPSHHPHWLENPDRQGREEDETEEDLQVKREVGG